MADTKQAAEETACLTPASEAQSGTSALYVTKAAYNVRLAELAQLRARVAILDAQEVELPEKESPTSEDGAKIRQWAEEYPNESSSFWAVQLVLLCRERQLLDALRAVQAWRGMAQSLTHGVLDFRTKC